MTVHSFPPRRIGRDSLPPQRVVLAPDPVEHDRWIAWVVGQRGAVVLERGTRADARSDAARFAARFRLVLEELALPFVTIGVQPRRGGGTVYLCPSERHGGSWDVMHASRSGDSEAVIVNCFSFGEALTAGRSVAAQFGANFAEDEPGDAA